MATPNNFEGDLSDITERQLDFIKKVIVEQGFANSKVTIQRVGQAGDNYVANVKRIVIENEKGKMQMIAKVAPQNEYLRVAMGFTDLFKNEHLIYTEFLPRLAQFQANEDVPKEEQLRFAKCYGSLNEIPHEIILLEDLSPLDFVMLDRLQPLPEECVKSMLRNFAILHAFSYALKKKDPDAYDYFAKNLNNIWLRDDPEQMEKFIEQMKSLEVNALMVLEDPEHKDIMKNKITDILPLAAKLSKLDASSKHSVIQQGDSWTNNIMFRFEEGSLKESIMIDWQIAKQSNPTCDLLYFLFNCTDHESRSKHFYDWLDYYHTELDKALSNYGLKANYEYPRDQLDADLRRYGKFMFGMSVVLASILTLSTEEAKVVQDNMKSGDEDKMMEGMKINDLNPESFVRFKNRVVGVITSFKEFGLL